MCSSPQSYTLQANSLTFLMTDSGIVQLHGNVAGPWSELVSPVSGKHFIGFSILKEALTSSLLCRAGEVCDGMLVGAAFRALWLTSMGSGVKQLSAPQRRPVVSFTDFSNFRTISH